MNKKQRAETMPSIPKRSAGIYPRVFKISFLLLFNLFVDIHKSW